MHRLVPVVVRELTDLVRECVKWVLIGVVFFLGMWFLTVWLPRLVAIINGHAPAPVNHSNHSAPVYSIPSTTGLLTPGGAP